jgi:DNA repair protein RecO (recombination protein O)
MSSSCQNFVMGTFTLYEGRNAYNLKSIDVTEYFYDLTADMEKFCYGSYFCEMMSYFTHEGERAGDYLNLLYVTFMALRKKQMPVRLIRCVYELKLMDIFGQGLQSFTCPVCGSDQLSNVFDSRSGGLICRSCLNKAAHPIEISKAAVYALQYINGAELGRLYSFNLEENVLAELEAVTRRFISMYVDKKFNSAGIIDSLS